MVDLSGLGKGFRVSPAVLGRRGSRLVFDASAAVVTATDQRSGLLFCPVQGVFHDPNAVFLGFGTPNVFMMLPRNGEGWSKFTAFMFYRQRSYVAKVTDRMQVGVYYELRGLPPRAIDAIRHQMKIQQGRRTASCANANARVLSAAGFTCGGRSLKRVYRPTHLAALIWEHGLEFEGTPVELRVIQAGREVGDHFVGVWLKEFTSLCRTVRKKFLRHDNTLPAPKFDTQQHEGISVERWKNSADCTTVGISRPSWVGAWLGFVLGQRAIFTAELGKPIEHVNLATPLPPFRGKLSWTTKVKKHGPFSRPMIWLMRRCLARSFDQYPGIPRQAVVEMLHRSTPHEPFKYNLVLTGTSVQITRLENKNGRNRSFINWVMAKHVLVSGYDPDTRFAGEVWCSEEDGDYVVYLSNNSGSYQPGAKLLEAAAAYLSGFFGVMVKTVLHQ